MPIHGKAGTGLRGDTSWAKDAGAVAAGSAGELRTERVLNDLAFKYPSLTVFHDVVVPNQRGHKYNIDHLVVAGTTVLPVDTKVWKPGFLWTVGGKTRRGFTAFKACDTRSVAAAHSDLERYLPDATVLTPLVIVWPSNAKLRLSLWAAKMPGARLTTSEAKLASEVKRLRRLGDADPAIVAALTAQLAR